MMRSGHDEMVAKLRVAFDLFEAGLEMMRARLRRELPDASDEEIARRLRAWLQTRPGAEFGDAEGRPAQWPRPRRPG